MVRTALPERLEAPPEIVVNADVLNASDGATDDELREESGFWVGDDLLMLVNCPMLLAAEEKEAPDIQVFLAKGRRLDCTLEGTPGSQYLVAKRLERQAHLAKTAASLPCPARRALSSRSPRRGGRTWAHCCHKCSTSCGDG